MAYQRHSPPPGRGNPNTRSRGFASQNTHTKKPFQKPNEEQSQEQGQGDPARSFRRRPDERERRTAFSNQPHRPLQRAQNTEKEGEPSWRPPCPHYPACSGCPFIHLRYAEQLEKKQELITGAFAAYSSLRELPVPVPVPSQRRLGYRARVKLAVQRIKGKPVIGLYRPESHQVVDTSACPVHPPHVNELISFLKTAIEELRISPYDERHDRGQLRHLDIRYSFWQRSMLLTLVTRHMDFPQVREISRALNRRFPSLAGLIQNINDTPGNQGNAIWGKRFHPLRGKDSLLEQVGHLRLHSPADAFTQINPPVAQKLYETVVDWANLSGQEIVLDLYCGIGPIALFLATRAKLVVGIDDNIRAINVAKENARRNGYHNTRFFAGDTAHKLRETALNLAQVDCIVVNPPRKGLSPEAFSSLVAVSVPRLLYVSCDPKTLARDLDQLSQVGYQAMRVQPFDMFPQTDKVETLVLLEKTQPGK